MQHKLIKNNQNQIYTFEEIKWNQWLAGIIDGDGYFNIQKNGIAICEITMALEDESLLAQIKQKLGGRLSLKSGARAIRYRLAHKIGIIELINRVNGFIRNSIRVPQFYNICNNFNIKFIEPKPLTINNGYMAGFFDADGSICISITKNLKENSIKSGIYGKIERLINSRGYHKLEIYISNKYKENLFIFKDAFGFGTIRTINEKKHKTHIYFINYSDIPKFIEYTKNFPLRSAKKKRLWTLKQYFDLKRCKAHLASKDTIQHKAWVNFCKKWYL